MFTSETKIRTHKLMPRDLACLTWIAFQYAIRLDQLQRLLLRSTPEQDRTKLKPGAQALSLDRTYEIINKWLALSLIEKATILHGDKLWIWLTRAGLRTVGLNFTSSGAPSSIRLSHLYYINQIRLDIEARRPDDHWKSEREIRKETPPVAKGESQPHIPDAILTNATNGKVSALEIEIHAKTDDELENDMRELAVTFKSIWYFTTRATRRQIEAMLDTFTPQMRKPFRLYDLKEYGNEYGIS